MSDDVMLTHVDNPMEVREPHGGEKPDLTSTRADWWKSPAGRAARQWLIAWGSVVQLRRATGDEAAIPGPLAEFMGGRRGQGMPDVLSVFTEVDSYVKTMLEVDERRLIEFIYVGGLVEVSAVQFVFDDGTRTEVAMEEEAFREPPVAWRQVLRLTVRTISYDLNQFEDRELVEVCRRWTVNRAGFLEQRHRSIAKSLADDLQLA